MCFSIKTKIFYKFVRYVIHYITILITVWCHPTAIEVPNAAEPCMYFLAIQIYHCIKVRINESYTFRRITVSAPFKFCLSWCTGNMFNT